MPQSFEAAAGPLYRRWRTHAHRFEARTDARFDVPGLQQALATPGLPRDIRALLATLGAGMSAVSTGERDAVGTTRRRIEMAATPDRPAMRCTVIEGAGRRLYSRDGRRFGEAADVSSPAETERALDAVDALELEHVNVTEDGARRVAEASLDDAAVTRLVDVRRLLGPGTAAASSSGTLRAETDATAMTLSVEVAVTATSDIADDIGFRSITVLHCTDLDGPGVLTIPQVSLSMPAIEGLQQAFRLGTRRGPAATKRRRR